MLRAELAATGLRVGTAWALKVQPVTTATSMLNIPGRTPAKLKLKNTHDRTSMILHPHRTINKIHSSTIVGFIFGDCFHKKRGFTYSDAPASGSPLRHAVLFSELVFKHVCLRVLYPLQIMHEDLSRFTHVRCVRHTLDAY